MKTSSENILMVLKIIAWIAFIGFSIECGSQLIAFVLGFFKPEYAENMYNVDQNWFKLREQSDWVYAGVMSAIIAVSAFKANIWFMLIDLLSKLKLENPFTMEVTKKLESIAYQLIVVCIATAVTNEYFEGIEKQGFYTISKIDDANEFLFIAGIVYIISQIFKRGIEMQQENELTV